jgi:hypothetical protein
MVGCPRTARGRAQAADPRRGRGRGLPIDARFAQADAEAELRSGFNALAAVLGDGEGTATEVLWGALHGMSLLERAGRMRPEHRPNGVAELAARFGA